MLRDQSVNVKKVALLRFSKSPFAWLTERILIGVLFVFSPTLAFSAITVDQTLQVPGNLGSSIVQAFTVNQTESVLVVGLYQDGTTLSYVRFGDGNGVGTGDQAADLILSEGRSSIAYFLNPSTDAGLSIRLDNGAAGFIGAWVLSGINLSEAPITDTDNSITTTAANMMIVSWAAINGSVVITADNGSMSTDITLFSNGTTGSGIGGNLQAPTAGAYNVGWSGDDESYGPFSLAFSEAVPGAISLASETASEISTTSANLSAQLFQTSANIMVYWEAGPVSDPSSHVGWDGSGNLGGKSPGAISIEATGLNPDTFYSFAFYGDNDDTGTEGWSVTAGTFSTNLSSAQAPSFTSTTQNENHLSVNLSWNDNATNETSYRLQRSFAGGAFSDIASLSTNTTSYADSVSEVGSYRYRLSAINSLNSSETDPTLCQATVNYDVKFGSVKTLAVTGSLGSGTISQAIQIDNTDSILVVGMYGDVGAPVFNNPRFGDGGGIGSGDQAADGIVTDTRGAMAYFLNPSTDSGLSFRADGTNNTNICAWELITMDLTVPPITSTSDTLTTTDNYRFIVSWGWANGNASSTLNVSGSANILLDNPASFTGGGGATGAGASIQAPSAGSYSTAWDNDEAGIGSPISMAFKRIPAKGTIFFIR